MYVIESAISYKLLYSIMKNVKYNFDTNAFAI